MQTGRLIPFLLGTIAVLIVGSGFLPLQWFGFQDYEIARQVSTPSAPFAPNLHLRVGNFRGGNAAAGNVPATEHLPPRTFTTDSFGFRYTPPVHPGKPASVMVFRGFSFVFGLGLDDSETFPAQLARQLNTNVYNASRFHEDKEMPADYDLLVRSLGAAPKIAVYVHLEPNAHNLSWNRVRPHHRAAMLLAGTDHYLDLLRTARYFIDTPLNWVRLSPVIRLAVEAKKTAENDAFMTNRYRQNLRSFPLPDGRPMLVLAGDLERVQTDFDQSVVNDRADYIAWWRDQLKLRNTPMLALLVPEKMSVYGPALGIDLPKDPYLSRLQRALEEREVHVVNGLPLLRADVPQDLATGHLSYLREDEHWNVSGVERLARATAQAMSRLGQDHSEYRLTPAKPE
jgi:SGNH hydrolase-like domain, acetyltransferase AlgX